MESVSAAVKKVQVATRRRTRSTSAKVTSQDTQKRKVVKRTRAMQRQQVAEIITMKENTVKMQDSSTTSGFQQLVPKLQPIHLACKENLVVHNSSTRERKSQPLTAQQPLARVITPSKLEVNKDCIHSFIAPSANEVDSSTIYGTAFTSSLGTGQSIAVSTLPHQSSGLHVQRQAALEGHTLLRDLAMYSGSVSTYSSLPNLQWVDSGELWGQMRSKDVTKTAPETELRSRHPGIVPSMRVILLDWMMEVCEEYKLHRETYYLAMDMYDRFMDTRNNILKEQLQLVGVTCLFIASKIEEIYPPKVSEFAYVTDGACTVSNILDTELIICKTLNWKLNHRTVSVNTWVNIYIQLASHHLRPVGVKTKEFEYPAYSGMEFTRIMQLLDLCMLDIASRQFSSSILAGAALYLSSERSRPYFTIITGLELSDIQMCLNWMHPCATVFNQKTQSRQKIFSGVAPQDSHNIQTHEVSISMLDDAIELRKSQESMPSQLTFLHDCSVLMTPPRSERRHLAPINTTC